MAELMNLLLEVLLCEQGDHQPKRRKFHLVVVYLLSVLEGNESVLPRRRLRRARGRQLIPLLRARPNRILSALGSSAHNDVSDKPKTQYDNYRLNCINQSDFLPFAVGPTMVGNGYFEYATSQPRDLCRHLSFKSEAIAAQHEGPKYRGFECFVTCLHVA